MESAFKKCGCLYVFLDEGGNLDFSANGTRYFTLTGVTKERSFEMYGPLTELKYDLLERGIDLEYFHASEDNKAVRAQVFAIIAAHLETLRIDSMIVDKKCVHSKWRPEVRFYPQLIGRFLGHLLQDLGSPTMRELLVITDQIPTAHRRHAVVKAIKMVLSKALPDGTAYRIFHHDSKSNFDLQIADYCNWALFRKWERGEQDYYQSIKRSIRIEAQALFDEG